MVTGLLQIRIITLNYCVCPGIRLVSDIFDNIFYFKNHSKLAAYCGLRWKKNQSGEKDSKHTKQTKTGNTYLRYYIVEATGSCLRFNDELNAFYHKKYKEVKINPHKRALVLTARKFVRLIYGLLAHSKLFDPTYQPSIS